MTATSPNPPTIYAPYDPVAVPGTKYTLIMVDDKINYQGLQTTPLQWLQSDLIPDPTTGLLMVDPVSSAVTGKYIPPEPVVGKPHSFISILYRQPSGFSLPPCVSYVLGVSVKSRLGFNLLDFVRATGLGDPVADNWFQAQNPTPATTTYAITTTLTNHYHVPCTPASSSSVPVAASSTPTPA